MSVSTAQSNMHRNNNNTPVAPGTKGDKRTAMGLTPPQNVAFAVNYSLPSVDQFIQTARTPADRVKCNTNKSNGEDINASPGPTASETETTAPPQRAQLVEKDMNRAKRVTVVDPNPSTPVAAKRSSNRDRKPREKSREKARVKYDMNHVPAVQRHHPFVAHHRRSQAVTHNQHSKRQTPPRRSTRAVTNPADDHTHASDELGNTCHKCKGEELPAPFVADSSVVWIPTKRSEWEDCLSEMTAVCTSSALRRHVASTASSSTSKPFFAPLSQDYIRDRIDIDDPLEGYQIRHKEGGWLQGFILWTNFTTWTHYFKWDSLDERSGVQASQKADRMRLIDADGSLSAELEAQPRSGDPLATGVVSKSIAEIALLGGIGCGEYLLRMAIDDIKSRGQYKYIVLQATDASRTFYERFGFVRVGAVCRYGVNNGRGGAAASEQVAGPTETDIVGYRHWTYANESNLETYGGPSYMMALGLPSDDGVEVGPECSVCSAEVQKPSVIVQLKAVAVDEKPKIAQLGAASTPYRRASLPSLPKPMPLDSNPSPYPPVARRRGRPPKMSSAAKPRAAVKPRPPGVSPYPPGVKRRGRPPKMASDVKPPPLRVSHYPPGVKKRGRPRKHPLPEPLLVASTELKMTGPGRPRTEPIKRGPGRPRKHPLPEPLNESGVKRKRGPGRPRKHPLREPSPAPPSADLPNAKRIKKTVIDVANLDEQRELLMAPAPDGQKLSFGQKQYQSVWLAVPPTTSSSSGGRRPPKQREVFMGNPEFYRKKRKCMSHDATSIEELPTKPSSVQKTRQSKLSQHPPGAKRRGRPPRKRRMNAVASVKAEKESGLVAEKSTTVTSEESKTSSAAPWPNEQKLSPYPSGVNRRGRPPEIQKPVAEKPPEEESSTAGEAEEVFKPSPYPPGVKRRGRPPKNKLSSAEKPKKQSSETVFAFKRRSPRLASDPSNEST